MLTFGSGVKHSFSRSSSGNNNDDFALVELGLDTLFPLGIRIGERRLDASVFVIGRHYFRELVFGQVVDQPVTIEQEIEIGLTVVSTPLPRLWIFKIPRLLIRFRFGEDLRGLRLKFGLPF